MLIRAADLFAGAGGTSTGLARACRRLGRSVDLVAVNHWPRAIATHELNHPWARHFCADLEVLSPRKAVPHGELDLIVAGVECTHHSRARGGRPMSDQRRSSAWHVLHWIEQLRVRDVLIENVREFEDWGPLDDKGRPIKAKRGQTFKAFVGALESLDYRVEWRVLTCADYGDPTTRRRLFLRARRGRGVINWPASTHHEDGVGRPRWRAAREIIDWSDPGSSIFRRKRPLAQRTLARIEEGIRRFCGEHAEPFLVILKGQSRVRSIDAPVPTVTAHARHLGLINPFLLPHDQFTKGNGAFVDSVERPLRTVTASNGGNNALVCPFLVELYGTGTARSLERPAPTVTAQGNHHALVKPFLIPHFGERPGQTPRVHSVDGPVPTVTATKGAGSLVTPFVVPYYGTGVARSIDQPLGAVTTKDRFGLVTPDGHAVDILFRMLQPRELARAQGFGDDYEFVGNKGEVVRQIGNAVPVNTAERLCHAILAEGSDLDPEATHV